MIKIGIVGEHPLNDSDALKALLENSKRYDKINLSWRIILRNMRGGALDGKNGAASKKAIKLLQQEFKDHKFNFVIYIRDLDGSPSEDKKIEDRLKWFKLLDKEGGNNNGIFFLAIFELEALMLADIATFNKIFKSNIKFKSNPLYQSDPKEFLIRETRKIRNEYKESDSKRILEQADFDKIFKTHKGEYSFQSFIKELDKKLGLKN